MQSTQPTKPSTGKVIGAFVLCWFVLSTVCIMTTWIGAGLAYGMSIEKPSTGGLVGLILGIVMAANYSSKGNLGFAVGVSAVLGLVLGIIVLIVSPMIPPRF